MKSRMITQDQAAIIILKHASVKEGRRKHIRTFRKGGKVFATINEKENRSCLRLSLIDQDVFSRVLPEHVFRVPNKNGSYGWTLFMNSKVPKSLYADAVQCAYEHILSLK
ncbi:MAG: MmcQ/YjbR family DNA-binding protein [Bacteroidota bacterium]